MKTKISIYSIMFFLGIYLLSVKAETKKVNNKTFTYYLCEAEYGICKNTCKVKLIKGDKISIGSYIKVYFQDIIITEGYILKHVSGSIFILKNKNEAYDPEICGGCCGGAYEIDISNKSVWGC